LDDALGDLRRSVVDGGMLVTGCFTWDRVTEFDHKVLTAYRWPVEKFVHRLTRAGFLELERIERPADGAARAHAAVAVRAV
jgi:hypothetical protein